jgi:surface protein
LLTLVLYVFTLFIENITFQGVALTNGALRGAVDLWVSDQAAATELYGDISTWDVSSVTNMVTLFDRKGTFNADISAWDVSGVITMYGMFSGASAFNQNISGWDVSSVTDMALMFYEAFVFNQDISGWDVSSVTKLYATFNRAVVFNQDISAWDVSSVTNMNFIFDQASAFNQNLCVWGSTLPFEDPSFETAGTFQRSGCPARGNPSFNTTPPGPFCYSCNSI